MQLPTKTYLLSFPSQILPHEITDVIPALSQTPPIAISHRKLHEFLFTAEAMLDIRDPKSDAVPVEYKKSTYKLRKRKRSSTSVEDLSSDTEAMYERDEKRAMEYANAGDPGYYKETGSDTVAIARRTSTRMSIKRAKTSS